MENKMVPIVTEKDLDHYEKRLNQMDMRPKTRTNPPVVTEKNMLENHLTAGKGKLVKVEVCGGSCLQSKIGFLLDVGEDFIVIKNSGASVSAVIPMSNLHCITFVLNNDRRQINRY